MGSVNKVILVGKLGRDAECVTQRRRSRRTVQHCHDRSLE